MVDRQGRKYYLIAQVAFITRNEVYDVTRSGDLVETIPRICFSGLSGTTNHGYCTSSVKKH